MLKSILYFCLLALLIYYFFPEEKLAAGTRIDRLVVIKSENRMYAYANQQLVRTYSISLGRQTGKKTVEGDLKTPEGIYTINHKNPNSGYHKNLGISYPSAADKANAAKLGKAAGGDIKIHGLRNHTDAIGKFHRWFNWTLGCIAVTNPEMDELYEAVPIGTPIEIKP